MSDVLNMVAKQVLYLALSVFGVLTSVGIAYLTCRMVRKFSLWWYFWPMQFVFDEDLKMRPKGQRNLIIMILVLYFIFLLIYLFGDRASLP